jgi:hypothetical protein
MTRSLQLREYTINSKPKNQKRKYNLNYLILNLTFH